MHDPPHLFVDGKITNGFSPIYRRCRIKNERVKQPIRALLGDSWVHCPRSHATPYVLQFAKSQIRSTADEWRGQSQLIALRPRIRRCSICKSSVIPLYGGELSGYTHCHEDVLVWTWPTLWNVIRYIYVMFLKCTCTQKYFLICERDIV